MGAKLTIEIVVIFLACSSIFSQGGGRGEPKRIEFANGKSATTLMGTLSNSQEMEYVLAAQKGQTVTLKMTNTNLFDYRIFNPENEFETEFDSSPVSTVELPESGDYFLFVRKKMVRSPRVARFKLVLTLD